MSIQVNNPDLKSRWTTVKFGDVVKNANLVERDPEAAGIDRIVGLDHLDPENLHIRRWNTLENGTSFSRKFVPGQTLFGKRRAYQRKVAFAEFEGICSGDILTFEPKDLNILLPELLPFICQADAFFDHALGTSAGSLSPRTSYKALQDFEFPLPPIEEQKRIAEILWAADEAAESYGKLRSELWRSRTILFESVLPNPDSDGHSNQVVRLDQVCAMDEGRVFPSKDYSDNGIRLIRPGNLGFDGTFWWTTENTRHLPVKYRDTASRFLVSPGEIVINLTAQSLEDGFIGRVCLTSEIDSGLLNQRLGRLVCRGDLSTEYLFRNMQTSRFRRLVETRCEGSKIRHIYFRHIADFRLVLLSKERQKEAARRCANVDEAYQDALTAYDRCRETRKLLVNSLLNDDLTGLHV